MHAEPDILKSDLFAQLGFGGDPAPYEQVLRKLSLSRPEKSRISASKRELVREALESRFTRVCARGDCQQKAASLAGARTPVHASSPEFCEMCAGSSDRSALEGMVAACLAAGTRRLCIVGGSPVKRDLLARLVDGRLELRLIDGTASHNRRTAETNTAWADLIVVWGSTQLDHRVSELYRGPKVLSVSRRGVQELAREVTRTLGKPR